LERAGGDERKEADRKALEAVGCGSGSLLLKSHDEAKAKTKLDLSLYGQEMDVATHALARMNMILHDCPEAEVWKDNTLSSPYFKEKDGSLKKFDFAVANPPFSNKSWTIGLNPAKDRFKRFELGTPPKKNGDYAFLLHLLTSLKSTGKGAIILPHGVLFRGNAEEGIRNNVVKRGYIKGIIDLPPNLFYGTGIPACIIVIDKENAAVPKGIFMIDASKGFMRDGNKNRLRERDIHQIVDAFTKLADVPKYSRMVPLAEIEANDFNLNLPRYIDSTEPEDIQDIDGHLRGGIPDRDLNELAKYWSVLPSLRSELFASADRPGYSALKLPVGDVNKKILDHSEFATFRSSVTTLFSKWQKASRPIMLGISKGGKVKSLGGTLSESLLEAFKKSNLLDPYDIYQHFMVYWIGTMQDDVYMIVADGWKAAAKPKPIVETKDKKTKEKPDFTIGKQKFMADLIPAPLLVAHYFFAERSAIEAL
jgi:type I restriction enzyme M protein